MTKATSGDDAARHTPRVAANPIPYWNRDGKVDKSKEVFDQAFADFADIGFTAVKADVPEGMSATEYADWIGSYGLAAVPEPVQLTVRRNDRHRGRDRTREAVRRRSGCPRLGSDDGLIDGRTGPNGSTSRGRGLRQRSASLSRSKTAGWSVRCCRAKACARCTTPMLAVSSRPRTRSCSCWTRLAHDIIGVGPDTGHLRWAGVDPAAFIRRYADRIGGIHIKDCFADYLDPAARTGMSYRELSATKRLWAEPGRGVVDFDAVIAAMPEDYDGDYMIEVDEPSVDSRYDSHKLSFEWARQALSFARI